MDKLVFVKQVTQQQGRNGNPYIQVLEVDGTTWNVFPNIYNAPIEANKAYLFTFDKNEKGFNDIKLIKPVVNIFKEKAMREIANKGEFFRHYSVCLSYAKDLVLGDKIKIDDLFMYAESIYTELNDKAEKYLPKEPD